MGQDEAFLRQLILPEEDLPHNMRRTNQQRWYRSANVIDLWQKRPPDDRMRIAERLKQQREVI